MDCFRDWISPCMVLRIWSLAANSALSWLATVSMLLEMVMLFCAVAAVSSIVLIVSLK